MGRQSDARERLLGAACRLIHSRGYSSIGVAEICAEADVRKGSFYHFFDSKQALTLEVIDAHWAGQRTSWQAILTAAAPAGDRLERLFRSQADAQRQTKQSTGVVNGCLLANLALELSNQDETVRTRLRQIFDEQVELVRTALGPSGSPETARAMVAQLEGMVLFAKLGNDPSLLDGVWTQARLLLS
ncbi:TetR/AcrR family transcriptional regulator [Nonomuraea sp. NPDC050394]|uniref:TetR/AcrR family transcriptional regulator n=1 Tax=Nonomuraea sp. NPDC050394 TaxID=3364363 RepID=UPI0037A815F4